MGMVAAIGSLNQSTWPEKEFGQGSVASKSAGGRPGGLNPGSIESPEEALTYIRQLYQDGRTEELVGLLRGNQVFREAWQTLQQSAAAGFDAGEQAPPRPTAPLPPEPSALPVPSLSQVASQNLNTALVAAVQALSQSTASTPNYPVPTPRPSFALTAGRRAYESQSRNFSERGGNTSRISIRV